MLFWSVAPGSAKITGFIWDDPCGPRSKITARLRENPKSFLGGGCRWIVNSLGLGSASGTISGSASSITPCSSKEADDLHLENPWDSPTGERLNGGVAKLELVVSVNESAEGLALVTTYNR